MCWVYKQTEAKLFTVGHYNPEGSWVPESDWPASEQAAARVNYLSGGRRTDPLNLDRVPEGL